MSAIDTNQIKEHMPVVDADGVAIGKVDHMQNGEIKLTKNDSPDGQHHLVPLDWIRTIDSSVHLSKSLAEIKAKAAGSAPTDAVPTAGEQDAVPKA